MNKLYKILLSSLIVCYFLNLSAMAANLDLDYVFNVKRSDKITAGTLTNDLMNTKELYKVLESRINNSKTLKKNVYLLTAEMNYTIAGMAIINAETMLSLNELDAASKDLDFALKKLKMAQLALMPSRVVEARGMYIDASSIPKTTDGIKKLCETLKEAGFNIIYPEVFRRGYTIYPSNLTETDPEFSRLNFNALKVLISQAHQNGMEVHPWIWTFRVRSPNFGNPVLSKIPALKAVPESDFNGKDDPLFLSPADPLSRQYVIFLLREMAKNYDIDGVSLDYIRYDETLANDTISLTKFRMKYLEQNGRFPPMKIEQGTPLYTEWQMFRENQINEMVRMISEELPKIKPDIYVGVSVFRNETYSRLVKMQNWRHWADNVWVTYVAPMLYTSTPKDLNIWLDWETNNGKRSDWLYPILGAHRFTMPEDIFAQISLLNKRKIPGMSVFALVHFNPATYEDLKTGPFRRPAYLPHRSPTIAVSKILAALHSWLLKMNKEELNNKNIDTYAINLDEVCESINSQNNDIQSLESLMKKLDNLLLMSKTMVAKKQIKEDLGSEIDDQVGYAQTLLTIHINRMHRKGNFIESTIPTLVILPETRNVPKVKVYKTDTAPLIDGKLDDPVWQKAEKNDKFYWNTGSAKSTVNTTFQVAYDNENLYVAFRNAEPEMSLIQAIDKKRDSGEMFVSDDSVELFIGPDIKNKVYYHLAVNTINTQFDQKVTDTSWNGKWQSEVQTLDKEWTVEIAIPFTQLWGIVPSANSQWRANFCRNRFQETNPFSAWSAPYGSYHNWERFGTLEF